MSSVIKVSTLTHISSSYRVPIVHSLQGKIGYSVERILWLLNHDEEILQKYNDVNPDKILDIAELMYDLPADVYDLVDRFLKGILFAKSLREMPLKNIDSAIDDFIQNGWVLNSIMLNTIKWRRHENLWSWISLKSHTHSAWATHIDTQGLSPELVKLLEEWKLTQSIWWWGKHNKKNSQFRKN